MAVFVQLQESASQRKRIKKIKFFCDGHPAIAEKFRAPVQSRGNDEAFEQARSRFPAIASPGTLSGKMPKDSIFPPKTPPHRDPKRKAIRLWKNIGSMAAHRVSFL